MGRPELEKAITALGTGGVLVLPEWDRATQSMLDGIQIIQRVAHGALVNRFGSRLKTPVACGAHICAKVARESPRRISSASERADSCSYMAAAA
jgi:hypothetical protein